MNKKVYIVECSKGYYDDYINWIVGVFTNYKDAKIAASKFTLAAEIIIANSPMEPDLPYNESFYKKEAVLRYKYWQHYRLYEEFHSAEVKEFTLNALDNLTEDPYNDIK